MPANPQVEQVCKQLLGDKKLASGYNAIGLSQGGQFLYVILITNQAYLIINYSIQLPIYN